MTGDDIPKYAPRCDENPISQCSLGRAAEACSPDPFFFCQSKRESDEAAADRSDRTLGRPRLAQPGRRNRHRAPTAGPGPGGHPPETQFSAGKTKIRLCWLIMTIKYDMQKYTRRLGESTMLAISRADTPRAMSPGRIFYK